MKADVILGDCLDVMRTMPAMSVDAVICDPPYSLSFMGRAWDTHSSMNDDPAFGYWLSGFIDGEGCFRVQKHERGTHSCAFSLKLRRDERGTLEKVRRYIGAGTIGEEEGSGGASPQARLVVQDKEGCQRLVDILDKYPLVAKKRLDFEAWAEAVCEWTTMPRGNRWHGPSDQTRMAALKTRIESGRLYTEIPWSGNGFQDWCRLWAAEALRVAKPGAALLAFGGTRTFHRLACAIEDSGWRIYDCLSWMYGQGFPKHRTHLKPAWEPVIFAAKKGARFVNVEGCRIGWAGMEDAAAAAAAVGFAGSRARGTTKQSVSIGKESRDGVNRYHPDKLPGRWPANVVLDEWQDQVLYLRGNVEPQVERIIRLYFGAVQGVREADPDVSESREAEEVLRPYVLRSVALDGEPGDGSSDVREEALGRVAGENEGHEGGDHEEGASVLVMEGRDVHDARVSDGQPVRAVGNGAGALREDGEPLFVPCDTGTPARDGEEAGEAAPLVGGSPPPERGQGGQPQAEPRAVGQRDTQAGPSGDRPRVTSASARERTAAGDRLEVRESVVPLGWRHLFEPTGRSIRCGSARMVDEQSGELTSGANPTRRGSAKFRNVFSGFTGQEECEAARGADSGGASRFFYTSKATRADREDGLEGVSEYEHSGPRGHAANGDGTPRPRPRGNVHPTVKPTDLMRWLCRLVTPPGGTVLDPFCGSGSTGVAANAEGFDFIGIEKELEYVEIARRRIANVAPLFAEGGAA